MRKFLVIAAAIVRASAGEQVRVTVYDEVALPAEVRESAVDDLRRIFRQSGVDLQWEAGALDADEASLFLYPGAVRKGHEQEVMCRARRDIALKINLAPRGLALETLGMAQPMAHAGLNARIFDDRVREAARRRNLPHAVVLAHAIAHEIGHVLLRSESHDPHGLMANSWSDYEYRWMARGLIFFTSDQSRRMRATLRNELCASAR
jgi:hypothetical protein